MTIADDGIDGLVEAEVGVKRAALMKANACRRICGLLIARGRSVEWEKALEHIAEHFHPDPSKPAHKVFAKKFRSDKAVKDLLYRAASGPSSVTLTKLTIGGRATGRPGVKIVRRFRRVVGDEPSLQCVVIIVDEHGTLITAYPAAIDIV